MKNNAAQIEQFRREATTRNAAIAEICAAEGKPRMAAAFMRSGLSVDAVRKQLATTRRPQPPTAAAIAAGWGAAFAASRNGIAAR